MFLLVFLAILKQSRKHLQLLALGHDFLVHPRPPLSLRETLRSKSPAERSLHRPGDVLGLSCRCWGRKEKGGVWGGGAPRQREHTCPPQKKAHCSREAHPGPAPDTWTGHTDGTPHLQVSSASGSVSCWGLSSVYRKHRTPEGRPATQPVSRWGSGRERGRHLWPACQLLSLWGGCIFCDVLIWWAGRTPESPGQSFSQISKLPATRNSKAFISLKKKKKKSLIYISRGF